MFKACIRPTDRNILLKVPEQPMAELNLKALFSFIYTFFHSSLNRYPVHARWGEP